VPREPNGPTAQVINFAQTIRLEGAKLCIGLAPSGDYKMSVLQAFALGAMVAWTPSLIAIAWLLWRTPLIGLDEWAQSSGATPSS